MEEHVGNKRKEEEGTLTREGVLEAMGTLTKYRKTLEEGKAKGRRKEGTQHTSFAEDIKKYIESII